MAIQHSAIPDGSRHEAKGASTATDGQVLKANGDGTTTFVTPNTLSNISIASLLEATSTTTQNPAGLDSPYQVVFGGGNSNSDVSVASNGVITISTTGLYLITFNMNFGRSTNVGTAKLVARLLANGAATGFTQFTQIDASTDIKPFNASLLRGFNAGNTITVEIIRDSTGANDGGLYTFNPALAGWTDSPSAAVRIQRVAGGA